MARNELTARVLELFPPLAEVEPWEWGETDEGEPVVLVERRCTFTGLQSGGVDLTAPIPNTSQIGADRCERPLRPGRLDGRSAREGGGRAGEEQLG
jgi:hypothetical protein